MTHEHAHHDHSQILHGMESADPIKVIESLEELRDTGKVTDIPILLELQHLSRNAEIKSKIIDILANLKENDSIPLMIAAIQNPRYAPELKDLIACCWENGLNFSGYLSLFVDLLIGNDFEIAFEAYTVIMNFEHRIEQTVIDQQVERLETALPGCSEMKRQLLLDVIDFLPGLGI